jgi:hypothetical protein
LSVPAVEHEAVPEVATTASHISPPQTQTAAAYDAVSQQPFLSGALRAFYTGVHDVWIFLIRLL